jgi:hypothetical protein
MECAARRRKECLHPGGLAISQNEKSQGSRRPYQHTRRPSPNLINAEDFPPATAELPSGKTRMTIFCSHVVVDQAGFCFKPRRLAIKDMVIAGI